MRRARLPKLVLASIIVVAGGACRRDDAASRVDSTPDTTSHAPPAVASEWAAELGQLVVVPADSENMAVVIYPDTPTARQISSARMTMLNGGGDTTVARLAPAPPDSLQCGDAPRVRIAGNTPAGWSVGLLGRSAKSAHMDSIESLPSADSTRLASDLARLGSAFPVPDDSRFKGLPFAVVTARRFEADGRSIVAAHLVRRLNQEAAPLEEHTFLIAERPAGAPPSEKYLATHHARSEGTEESAERFDVLAAVRGDATLLLISREQETHTTYEVLERLAGGWKTRWSRTLSC
jgi:hypothetical protein